MMDVSGVRNKLRRSIQSCEEVHSRGRPLDRQYEPQIFPSANISIHSVRPPFIRAGIIKLLSQESSGPRQREGITVRTHLKGNLQQRPR